MIRITVSGFGEEFDRVSGGLRALGERSMPATAQAFLLAAEKLVMGTWKSYASGESIPGTSIRIKSAGGGYAASIKSKRMGPFDWVVYSESPVAKWVEEGTARADLKDTHPFGRKSRVGKDGTPYLIVPFRQGTPGSRRNPMPMQIYRMVRRAVQQGEFAAKRVLPTTHAEANVRGEPIERHEYTRGSRLTGLGPAFANLEGMSAFDVGSDKAARSTYFTFRVISAKSPEDSWIKPAVPGKHITKHVAKNTEEDVQRLVELGLRKDLGL